MHTPVHAPASPVLSSRRPLVRASFLVLAALAWYAFRPDRLVTTRAVAEAAPFAAAPAAATPAGPTALVQGRLHSNAHETVGTAAVLDLGGGRRVLRLTGFRTSNGPDVRVVLVAAADVPDNVTAPRAGYVELGRLTGTRGDQNYEVPASLDLANYRTVTIWCERFDVNFGSAPLAGA